MRFTKEQIALIGGPEDVFDQGVKNRLEARIRELDTLGIRVPKYKTSVNFFSICNEIRYQGFIKNLNEKNPGKIIDRLSTEAAFYKVVSEKFKYMDLELVAEKFGTDKKGKEKYWRLLADTLWTMWDDPDDPHPWVEAHWREEKQKDPNLAIISRPCDDSEPEDDDERYQTREPQVEDDDSDWNPESYGGYEDVDWEKVGKAVEKMDREQAAEREISKRIKAMNIDEDVEMAMF